VLKVRSQVIPMPNWPVIAVIVSPNSFDAERVEEAVKEAAKRKRGTK
jgi:hypothetical protein